MSRRIKKMLAVVSATAAVGVMPLLGLSTYNTMVKDETPKVVRRGITDVLYDDTLAEVKSISTEYSSVDIVGNSDEDNENIEQEPEETNEITVSSYTIHINNQNNFKSYMPYKAITDSSSKQFKLQQMAITSENGIRIVNDRYCVAVGTAINADVGTYIDLVLENGTIIPCIVGDIKSDQHTLSDQITTASNGCVSEFIVCTEYVPDIVKTTGSYSYNDETWNSAVSEFIVYEFNILETE